MITAKLVWNAQMDCGVGVEERFGDCLEYPDCVIGCLVVLGGVRVRRHR